MDHATIVRSLLEAAGFDPPAEEVAGLVEDYARIQPTIAALYAVEATRYEAPGLVFDPESRFADWA